MGEKELTISIRIDTEVNQLMEDYMAEKKIDSRSRFIRDAISGYIDLQRRAELGGSELGVGIFVRLREAHIEALRLMVEDGTAFSEEEYVRNCLMEKLVSPEAQAESAKNAFKAAQLTSKMK
jgi:metal-responsive CopG/Arc/MetJ family transcriptional regulator